MLSRLMIHHETALFMDKDGTDNQDDGNGKLQANQANPEGFALLRGAKGAFQGKGWIERSGKKCRIDAGYHRDEQRQSNG